MTPTRTAIVATTSTLATATRVGVTVPRLPWEPDITEPDARDETRPRALPIRSDRLDERTGPMAPAQSAKAARRFAARSYDREAL
jgi:hypothetical protein